MAGRRQWDVDEPRFTPHPYYDEWTFTFLEVNNFDGGLITRGAKERITAWVREHCVGRVYLVGNRISFMENVDAMAFQITWG